MQYQIHLLQYCKKNSCAIVYKRQNKQLVSVRRELKGHIWQDGCILFIKPHGKLTTIMLQLVKN